VLALAEALQAQERAQGLALAAALQVPAQAQWALVP